MLLMLSAIVSAGRAGLVVQFSNSSIFEKCVDFKDGESAFEFIKNSGLVVGTYKYETLGIALCKIGPFGCDASNCFCKSDYWGFYYLDGKDWKYSDSGIGDYKMRDGDVIGFRWGSYGDTPEMHSFNELCESGMQKPTMAVITAPKSVPANSTVLVRMTSANGKPLVYESIIVEFSGGKKELITNESGEATFSAGQAGVYAYSSPNHLLDPRFTDVTENEVSLKNEGAAPAQKEEAQTVSMTTAAPSPLLIGGGVILILVLLYLLQVQLKRWVSE
jgi:hypothetical protein